MSSGNPKEHDLSLDGLAELVLREPRPRQRRRGRPRRPAPRPRPDRPGALRPVRGQGAGRRRPDGAGRRGHRAGGRGARRRSSGCVVDPATVAYYPAWETLPHERLSPRSDTVGRRLAVLRRLAHPGTRPQQRPAARSSSPRSARCSSPRSRGSPTSSPSSSSVGDEVDLEDVVRRLAARRLPPGRPGGEARRVRGPRRHRRRLPADRGAPAPRGVLGRRGRGDPVVLRRRPALAREGRAAVGAALPRAAAHRRGAARGPGRWGSGTPSCAEIAEKLAEGHAVEGMESLAPVLVDEMELLVDLLPAGHPRPRARPRARAQPRARPGRHQRRVPARLLGRRGRRAARPRSTSARRRTARSPTCARTASRSARPGGASSPFGLDPDAPRTSRALATSSARRRRGRRRPRRASAVESRSVRRPRAYHGDVERAVADIRAWLGRRRPGRRGLRGPRPGPADGRGAPGARRRRCGSSRTSRRPADVPAASWSSPPARSPTASSTRRSGSRSSPATTSSGSAPPPRTCAGCRPGARSRSTRSS